MNKYCVEYVWIGGKDNDYNINLIQYVHPFTLRSKTRILEFPKNHNIVLEDISYWNYDGSSTGQATTEKSEVFIKPCAIFNDPFRRNNFAKIVLCDTYVDLDCTIPHNTNTRYLANEIFSKDNKYNEEPWFGLEQEFFLINKATGFPLGFNANIPQGQYYCSVGSKNAFGRNVVEEILQNALYAGISVSGMNAEVAPGQWEIQVGIVHNIDASDQLWMLRYIMNRTTENYNCYIDLHPKPLSLISNHLQHYNGSGLHTNYSVNSMRNEMNGYSNIDVAINKLKDDHNNAMKLYGDFNESRLSGSCETSSYDKFSFGVADRSASIRIPSETFNNGYGYIEDRRPSSLMDPYLVTSYLYKITVSNE